VIRQVEVRAMPPTEDFLRPARPEGWSEAAESHVAGPRDGLGSGSGAAEVSRWPVNGAGMRSSRSSWTSQWAASSPSQERACASFAACRVLLLRDVGFSLAEQKAFMASRAVALDGWQRLARRKLAELDDQIAKAQTAREAIDHALRCPYEDILECPNFARVIAARLAGQPLHEAHQQ
jgi:hypothetical protein